MFAKETFYQLSYLPTLRKIFVVVAAVWGFFFFFLFKNESRENEVSVEGGEAVGVTRHLTEE